MTDEELAALEALAKKATPGPWEMREPTEVGRQAYEHNGEVLAANGDVIADGAGRYGHDAYGTTADNLRFIASANPQTVLALVAEVRQWRGLRERFENEIAGYDIYPLALEAFDEAVKGGH